MKLPGGGPGGRVFIIAGDSGCWLSTSDDTTAIGLELTMVDISAMRVMRISCVSPALPS